MFITKLSLPRRTFLRGMGVTLALPLLESMVPALTATAKTAANPQRRFGAIFVPLGERPGYWTPKAAGANFEFTPILKPLEPFRETAIVIAMGREQERDARRLVRRPVLRPPGVAQILRGGGVLRREREHGPAELAPREPERDDELALVRSGLLARDLLIEPDACVRCKRRRQPSAQQRKRRRRIDRGVAARR